MGSGNLLCCSRDLFLNPGTFLCALSNAVFSHFKEGCQSFAQSTQAADASPFLFKSCSLYTAANLGCSAFVSEVINVCELGHAKVWKCTNWTSVSGALFSYIPACSCNEMCIPVETFLHDSNGLNFLSLAKREISVSKPLTFHMHSSLLPMQFPDSHPSSLPWICCFTASLPVLSCKSCWWGKLAVWELHSGWIKRLTKACGMIWLAELLCLQHNSHKYSQTLCRAWAGEGTGELSWVTVSREQPELCCCLPLGHLLLHLLCILPLLLKKVVNLQCMLCFWGELFCQLCGFDFY